MSPLVLDPADSLEQQNEKLRRITEVLMRRIEREIAQDGTGYASFQWRRRSRSRCAPAPRTSTTP